MESWKQVGTWALVVHVYLCSSVGAHVTDHSFLFATTAGNTIYPLLSHGARANLLRLLPRKITWRYQTFDVEGAQAPPAATYGQGFNKGCPCTVFDWIGRDRHG